MQSSQPVLSENNDVRSIAPTLGQNLCLLLANLVDSSPLPQKNNHLEGRKVAQRHYDTLVQLIEQYAGRIRKPMDDTVVASFSNVTDALNCSVAIQQSLLDDNESDSDPPPVQTKIALHYGSAGGETDEVCEELLNISARLNDATEAAQILLSQAVYDQLNRDDEPPLLPYGPICCKEDEDDVDVYEVLWQQSAELVANTTSFRSFSGTHHACFYCGLKEHLAMNCPSKQMSRNAGKLNQLGYQPLHKVLGRFQQADLNASTLVEKDNEDMFEAYYEIYLPYQLRFLSRVWVASNENWRSLCQPSPVVTSSLAGTRLCLGVDALRAGRLKEAQQYLDAALDSNRGDHKPYVALGFLAMENGQSYTTQQYWRKALPLVKTNLQGAYIHLLLHRSFDLDGQMEKAQQELNKALDRYPYLDEANYRRRAIQFKLNNNLNLSNYLKKLTSEDRTAFLKVALDPAFVHFRNRISPILTTILQETRNLALVQMKQASDKYNELREWYQQPEAELQTAERSLQLVTERIKSDSYLGYCDAVKEAEVIQKRYQILLSQRIAYLHKGFNSSLGNVAQELKALIFALNLGGQDIKDQRMAGMNIQLSRLQGIDSFTNADQFWCAWHDLQSLKTTIRELEATDKRQAPEGRDGHANLRFVFLTAIFGSIVANIALLVFLVFLIYILNQSLSALQWYFLFAAGTLGGLLAGAAVGSLWRWYHSRN
ncbi:MAG: hypothetical protein O7G88_00470 [bacterium]|nr:hypothetical protein [bacterium]